MQYKYAWYIVVWYMLKREFGEILHMPYCKIHLKVSPLFEDIGRAWRVGNINKIQGLRILINNFIIHIYSHMQFASCRFNFFNDLCTKKSEVVRINWFKCEVKLISPCYMRRISLVTSVTASQIITYHTISNILLIP